MKNKNYKINEEFFNEWSNDMAYILGFTTTDGCITDDNRLSYGLNSKDRHVLDFISSKICPGRDIKISEEKRKNTICSCARLRIGSKYLCCQLKKLGIVPRKTGKEALPEIPDKYKHDYLRGLFDGDGSIHITNKSNNQLTFQICSASKSFLEDIKFKIGGNTGYIKYKGKNCWTWIVYKQCDILNLYKYMYKTKSFYLLRKKTKFEEGRIICQKY